jgi:hypothetical protein
MIEFNAGGTIMHMEVPLLAKTAKTAEPLEMSAQPTGNKEPAVASVQVPSQVAPVPPVLPTPIDLLRMVPP